MIKCLLREQPEETSADRLKLGPLTAATAERRFRSAVLEAAQDLLLADVAVTHQQELEQVVVLLLLTRLRRAGLTCSHNIRLSQILSILQATREATLVLSLRFPPCSRSAEGSPPPPPPRRQRAAARSSASYRIAPPTGRSLSHGSRSSIERSPACFSCKNNSTWLTATCSRCQLCKRKS